MSLRFFLILFIFFEITNSYSIGDAKDKRTLKQIEVLLKQEGIQLDGNLEYTCALYDDDYNVIGTGSIFGNTLRCFAVSKDHQGEGLLAQIISHLMQKQYERNIHNLFIYTKCESEKFFKDMGFYEIATVNNMLVFMENRKAGFSNYLKALKKPESNIEGKKIAALVMNANPFTLGHQYLVEKASKENDIVHLFIVTEDASLVPYKIRKKLIEKGTEHLPNIILQETGPYIISNSTFPSYFLKETSRVIEGHAKLDVAIFTKIAKELSIQKRYVGEEPTSKVTGIYNEIMKNELPKSNIECVIVPRKEFNGKIISASTVRECLKKEDFNCLKDLVPKTTLEFFTSEEAKSIIEKIKKTEEVKHY